ncbi:hypothetical protein, partial [Vibrio mediterranei]|uniref:hypothetical protein n=1 Tax=Vibrio mediterranei TaxID=689 RepID=UPI001EFE6F8C
LSFIIIGHIWYLIFLASEPTLKGQVIKWGRQGDRQRILEQNIIRCLRVMAFSMMPSDQKA